MWRDVHSYLSHVLVGAQETLDVAEHLGDRHFSQTVESNAGQTIKRELLISQTQLSISRGGKSYLRPPLSPSRRCDVILKRRVCFAEKC